MAATIIPATFIKVTEYKHTDSGEHRLLCGIRLNSGVAVAEAYKVARNNTAVLLFQETMFGKDDSICGIVFNDGTACLDVSSADSAGASGTTSAVRNHMIPGAFPPAAISSSNTTDAFIRLQFKNFLIGLRDLANKFISLLP